MKALLSATVAVALSLSAAAQAGSLVDVTVIDRDTGSTLPARGHDGRLYIAGMPGHRYAVRLYNRTGARVLTVLSVDGVNAITGQTANPQQSGYVLDAYQSTEVDGWRKDMSEIAQFNFTALDNSYAARTGRPNNVGVIGVAVFRERAPIWRERDDKISMRESAPAQPYKPPTQRRPHLHLGAGLASGNATERSRRPSPPDAPAGAKRERLRRRRCAAPDSETRGGTRHRPTARANPRTRATPRSNVPVRAPTKSTRSGTTATATSSRAA